MRHLTWTRPHVGTYVANVPDNPLEFVAVVRRVDLDSSATWWFLRVTTHGRPLHEKMHQRLAEAKADANQTWLAVAQ